MTFKIACIFIGLAALCSAVPYDYGRGQGGYDQGSFIEDSGFYPSRRPGGHHGVDSRYNQGENYGRYPGFNQGGHNGGNPGFNQGGYQYVDPGFNPDYRRGGHHNVDPGFDQGFNGHHGGYKEHGY